MYFGRKTSLHNNFQWKISHRIILAKIFVLKKSRTKNHLLVNSAKLKSVNNLLCVTVTGGLTCESSNSQNSRKPTQKTHTHTRTHTQTHTLTHTQTHTRKPASIKQTLIWKQHDISFPWKLGAVLFLFPNETPTDIYSSQLSGAEAAFYTLTIPWDFDDWVTCSLCIFQNSSSFFLFLFFHSSTFYFKLTK